MKQNKPILVWHSRHPLLPDVRAALAAYDIRHINSYHTTRHVPDVWHLVRIEAHCIPDVILTTWDHAPLLALARSTRQPENLLPNGHRCQIVRQVMTEGAPDVWSGAFREFVWSDTLRKVIRQAWIPIVREGKTNDRV